MLTFINRKEFRDWLKQHALSEEGVWLLFGKKGGPKTLTAKEALEEALCFGWIDGQMKSIDDTSYKKYFSIRRKNSKWSSKNKSLMEQLEQQGIMSEYGRIKIEEAKKNGQWDASNKEITQEDINVVISLLEKQEPAYTNFINMSPSIQKTYTRAYFSAKTEAGKKQRLLWLIERLHKNLKPMQ